MLHIIIWATPYTLILLLIGRVTRSWRDSTGYKVVFLPGTLLGAMVKRLASLLCLGSPGTIYLLRGGEPYFKQPGQVAYLPGGFFLVVTHSLAYVAFVVVVGELDARGILPAYEVSLPNLYPYELVEGYVQVDTAPYFDEVLVWIGDLAGRPLHLALVIYASLCLFGSLAITGREWRHGGALLVITGAIVYTAGWFGIGVQFLSQAWWAGLFYVPRWWAIFSLFLTVALLSLCTFVAAMIIFEGTRASWRKLSTRPPPPR